MTTTRAHTWILASARTGEIVSVLLQDGATEADLEALAAECSGSADSTASTGESEYWGATPDGAPWRVHVEMDC
jgi:hypothetical protein